MKMAEVVAQFVDRLLLTPEVHSSNLVIGKLLYRTFVYCLLYWKNKDKEKEAVNGPFKNCCEKTKRRPEWFPSIQIYLQLCKNQETFHYILLKEEMCALNKVKKQGKR